MVVKGRCSTLYNKMVRLEATTAELAAECREVATAFASSQPGICLDRKCGRRASSLFT
jgi:hypothetical protein